MFEWFFMFVVGICSRFVPGLFPLSGTFYKMFGEAAGGTDSSFECAPQEQIYLEGTPLCPIVANSG